MRLGGGIKQADIESVLHPAMLAAWTTAIDRDCPQPRSPPTCNCDSQSTGASLLSFLDTAPPRDCVLTLAEVSSTLNSLLTPDLDLFGAGGALGPDGVNDSVSFGVGVQAVSGTFPVP